MVVEVPTVPEPPLELTDCESPPAVPGAPLDGREVGVFILELSAAGADCRATLHDLRRWLEDARARTTAPTP